VFKGWLGGKNRSHHHMEQADQTESHRRACKDEMMMWLQHGVCVYLGHADMPDTVTAIPTSNPSDPLPHHNSSQAMLPGIEKTIETA